jgi:hypothetical protein
MSSVPTLTVSKETMEASTKKADFPPAMKRR